MTLKEQQPSTHHQRGQRHNALWPQDSEPTQHTWIQNAGEPNQEGRRAHTETYEEDPPQNRNDEDQDPVNYWMSDDDTETDDTRQEPPNERRDHTPPRNPEDEDPTNFNAFEAKLIAALRENDINTAKHQLTELRQRHTHAAELNARGDMSMSQILFNLHAHSWPQASKHTCIVRDCGEQTESEGMMRKHLKGKHGINTNQTADVLDLELEHMLQKTIITRCTLPDGNEPQEINFRDRIRSEIRCHACPYQTDHDYNLRNHRKKHKRFAAEIEIVGLFWATLRWKARTLERIPTLQEFLGCREPMTRCRKCGLKTDQGTNNMHIHLTRKHPEASLQQDTEPVVVTHMLCDEYQEQYITTEEEETPEPIPQQWPRAAIETPLEINEAALAQLQITSVNILKAYEEHNSNVLASILTLAAETEGNCYRDTIELMKRVKQGIETPQGILNLDDNISEVFYKIPTQEWPLQINKHQCHHCDLVFATPNHWRQHMTEHTLTYSEASEAKDFVRKHMAPSKYCATTSNGQVLTAIKGIYRCEVPGCSFCTTDLRELDKHRRKQTDNESHTALWAQQNKYGAFFGQLKYMINRDRKVPTVREFLGQTRHKITLCMTCFAVIGRTEQAVQEHYRSRNHAHTPLQATQASLKEEHLNYEEPQRTYNEWNGDRIRLSAAIDAMWTSARQERTAEQREQAEEERRRLEATIIANMRNHMQRQALEDEEDSTTEEEHQEPQGTATAPHEPTLECALNEETPRHIENAETNEARREHNQARDRKIQKARTWLLDGIEREKRGIRMPRLNRKERKLVQDGLKDLFADELTPILEEYTPQGSDPEEWEAFQGAIYQCQHLMRVHILSKLGKPLTQMLLPRKKPFVNDYTKTIEKKEAKGRRLLNITKSIEELTLAVQNEEERKTQQLVQQVSTAIYALPQKERVKWWGTHDITTILSEIERQVGNEEAYGEWLEHTIIAYTAKIQAHKSTPRNAEKIREEYSDNAKKYVHNILWEAAKPECQIELDAMRQHLKTMFEPEDIGTWNDSFQITSTFEEDDLKDIQEHITKNLEQTIASRSWLSAPGPDGIDYSLYKLGGKRAREWLQKLFDIIITTHQMPAPLMKSRTIFAYKKGDVNMKESWRPLTISNASYRILMVALNNALQDLNKMKPLINSNQKGFMNSVNGCIENALTIAELFYHAERKQKSLYVVALDFKNAFGSVNHEFIEEVLKRKQMPKALRQLIMSMYKGATTRIQQQGRTSEEVVITGGTKQGCPLSPFLFNLCLDPLITELDKLAPDVGYQVGDEYFAVQAYADDILLISKNAEGIKTMIERI